VTAFAGGDGAVWIGQALLWLAAAAAAAVPSAIALRSALRRNLRSRATARAHLSALTAWALRVGAAGGVVDKCVPFLPSALARVQEEATLQAHPVEWDLSYVPLLGDQLRYVLSPEWADTITTDDVVLGMVGMLRITFSVGAVAVADLPRFPPTVPGLMALKKRICAAWRAYTGFQDLYTVEAPTTQVRTNSLSKEHSTYGLYV